MLLMKFLMLKKAKEKPFVLMFEKNSSADWVGFAGNLTWIYKLKLVIATNWLSYQQMVGEAKLMMFICM